jgi:hypothetical protein
MEDDECWEITTRLAGSARDEQEGEARAIVAAGRAKRTFGDKLRRLAPGDVITVATVDGASIRGRILAAGVDYACIGEVSDAEGAGRARLVRVHDVRLDAIVRITREPDA